MTERKDFRDGIPVARHKGMKTNFPSRYETKTMAALPYVGAVLLGFLISFAYVFGR